jgi:thiol-disulfide isomerase/thioredoxin
MDINDKSYVFGICSWLKTQPQYTERDMGDENNLFYNISPYTYANFIYDFIKDKENHEMIKNVIEESENEDGCQHEKKYFVEGVFGGDWCPDCNKMIDRNQD